ncbi:helix-turn-helix domain-containing protein [Streptomyces decoyicus]|uniref:helix-turn-helix domain-containing protein n=1 Tax=Streptomyces decoyicus TaxID=249567 RepID=UPI0036258E2D
MTGCSRHWTRRRPPRRLEPTSRAPCPRRPLQRVARRLVQRDATAQIRLRPVPSGTEDQGEESNSAAHPQEREAVGMAYRPLSSASGSSVPPLSRPQLAEARRVRAVELFEEGGSNPEIARAVGVCAESVRRWRRVWEEGGAPALCRRPATGLPKDLLHRCISVGAGTRRRGRRVPGRGLPERNSRGQASGCVRSIAPRGR